MTDKTTRPAQTLRRLGDDLHRTIVERSPLPVMVLDRDGTVVYVSPSVPYDLGWSKAELVGHSVLDFLHPDDRERAARVMSGAAAAPRLGIAMTLCWRRRHSGYVAVEAAIRSVVGEVGDEVEGSVVALRTNPLQWSDLGEVLGLVAELKRTVERLERSNQELAGLARITAHDLAAPLRAVSGLIDLLPQAEASPDTRRTFDAIRSAIDRMQAMVADITGYVQARSEEPRWELVNLNELVGRIRETLHSEIADRRANFIAEELPSIFGEEHQLERVFLNLISNALKYSGEHSPDITVYARRTPGAWRISVADHGIGVNEADRDRIFELFVRGDVESGSGIGLATCRRIVELHGGRIWVEPNEPAGAVFNFTLPDEPTVAGADGSFGPDRRSPADDVPD